VTLISHPLRLGPLENNSYIVACTETREAAVLDVGFEPAAAIREVRRHDYSVRWLLCTHAHYDHVAGMREVQEACGGEFRLHPADHPLLAQLTQQGAMFGFPPASPPDAVADLVDGERIALGHSTLEVIHTPGHSPGGVCFRSGDDLWAGDTLFAGSIGRTDLPGGSFPQLAHAIRERLFPLGDAVRVHPGHGEPTTIGEERRHNPFVGIEANLA
jgi:hydroxyacylglutathione hydrolase